MANLHNEFASFHKEIALTSEKKQYLKTSRNANRERIRKHFRETLEVQVPRFHGQGSYAMGTTVNPLGGEYDIDDGVYLQHLDESDDSTWPTPETVHRWLVKATEGYTREVPTDKNTCVRVKYAGGYHVDLPSYGKLNVVYKLAVKGDKGWHPSDPKALTVWFKENVLAHGEVNGKQLLRIVRYFKAWADFQSGRRGKMPNGLILTVLVTQQFRADDRDDIAVRNAALAISHAVNPVFCVTNPVDWSEELTARLLQAQKQRFKEAISDLAADAAKAVQTDDEEESSKLWRKQLGDRFPLLAKEESAAQKQEAVNRLAVVYSTKNTPKPWGYS